jgi:hypothetical protein
MTLDRRALLGLGAAAAAAGLAGCAPGAATTLSTSPDSTAAIPATASPSATASLTPTASASSSAGGVEAPWGEPDVKLGPPIGDGSQAPAVGPQPFQRPITKLAKGEKPPQFVVFSWDGASGNNDAILDYVKAAHAVNGTQTMFTSALYFLPKSLRTEYQPPKRPAGDSDIPYMSDPTVRKTITDTAIAWTYGNEIGTHFCGHFADPNGVPSWTTADWEQEISQVYKLMTTWRTITGWTDVGPLPFDYTKELVGARTPLLAGRGTLLPAAKKHGWRYDSSGVRGRAAWPVKDDYGLYDISMFSVPFRDKSIIPMDYNFLVSQAKGDQAAGSAAERAKWKAEHAASLRAGLKGCLNGNRAPFIIGNHLSPWLGGIYQDNLLALMTEFGRTPQVQLVSFRWLCDWMDAQDPEVLAALQAS